MSYIDHIRAFENWLEVNSISCEQQMIYYKLLSLFNKAGWPESVQVDNPRLQSMCGIESQRSFERHKAKLLTTGLIKCRKGYKTNPNRYTLCYECFPGWQKPSPPPPTPPAPAEAPREAPKKRSTKRKPAVPKVFIPPSKEEVIEYCRSRVSSVDPVYFWEYFNASGWIDSKGNPVQNWKGKIITWEKHQSQRSAVQEEPRTPPAEPQGHLETRIDAYGRKRTVWVEE